MTKQEEIRRDLSIITQSYTTSAKANVCLVNSILGYLHSQGVAIKVNKPLPRPRHVVLDDDWKWMEKVLLGIREQYIKAGYTATEPLIKEG